MNNLKIIALFSLLLLISCSSNDDDSNSNIQINPPNWIQGVWLEEGIRTGFEFTTNDVILITIVQDSSQREILENFEANGYTVSSSEEVTDNFYSLVVNHPNGVSYTYSFNKISETIIRWTSAPTADLIKQ